VPRTCTVCRNVCRQAIEAALIAGTPFRRISSEYVVSESAVRRHAARHLPARLAKAKEAEELADAGSLLAQVRSLQEKALSILAAAEKAGELRTALMGVREARECLLLLARITGELERAKNPYADLSDAELLARITGLQGFSSEKTQP